MRFASPTALAAGISDVEIFQLDHAAERGDLKYLLNVANQNPDANTRNYLTKAIAQLLALHVISQDLNAIEVNPGILADPARFNFGVDIGMVTPGVRALIVSALPGARTLIADSIKEALEQKGIFKKQDLRGHASRCLTAEVAYRLGRATGAKLIEKNPNGKDLTTESLVVTFGQDARLSGNRIKATMSRGLVESGVRVIDITPGNQVTTTPMVGFSITKSQGGVS